MAVGGQEMRLWGGCSIQVRRLGWDAIGLRRPLVYLRGQDHTTVVVGQAHDLSRVHAVP